MMKQIEIRPLAPQETAVLTDFLYHAIFVPPGVEPPPLSIVEKPELQVYVSGFGTQPDDYALVAEKAGEIIGAVWVRDMQDYGHLKEGVPSFAISVLPGYRNQGVGTALMQHMLEHLHNAGYPEASLSVQKRNPAARLYRRLGFCINKENDEEYVMVWKPAEGKEQTASCRIVDNQLTADDFIRLFASAGWGEPPRDLTEAALKGSYATFSLCVDGQTVAMARLLGDGAMAFFLKDFVVAPAYQGQGLGRHLLEHVEAYIRKQLKPGWNGYLELASSKGKEGFYQRMGYEMHPDEQNGPGMAKWICHKEGL